MDLVNLHGDVIGNKIAEGKTKKIFKLPNGKEVLIFSKDSITAGNGLKKDNLDGKGKYSTTTTSNVFRVLELKGIPTHFVAQSTPESFRAISCTMIPLEVIVRRIAAGSILKRNPELKQGQIFETPLVEFTFKDDEKGDPLVTDEEVISMNLNCGGIKVDKSILEIIKTLAIRSFIIIEHAWKLLDVTLVDFKVEFGVSLSKQIILADVIDNDSWRIWPKGDPNLMKDKQIYRNLPIGELSNKDRNTLIDSYRWVADQTNLLIDSTLKKQNENQPLVGVIMGSESDWDTMKYCISTLQQLNIPFESKIVSAHRTPDRLFNYAKKAETRGLKVIIAGAGGAAHLPGMTASLTNLPVLGVPMLTSNLNGMDSLLSIVQMPGGVPVGTLAVGKAGAINAALLAAEILSISTLYPDISQNLQIFRKKQTESVNEIPKELDSITHSIPLTENVNPIQFTSQLPKFSEKKLPPGSTIGIIGGGQLAKMTAIAASNLGYKCHIFCPEKDSPAFQVASEHTLASYNDLSALASFASRVDVVTYEFENIPLETVEHLANFAPVRPKPQVLGICQNRVKEKRFISSIGVPVTKFEEVSNYQEFIGAIDKVSLPAILKSNTMGYDGKGQAFINSKENLLEIWEKISKLSHDKTAILEAFVEFEREVSVIVSRSFSGEVVTFPVVENRHEHHILKETIIPARVSEDTAKIASESAKLIAQSIDLVGVLAVEMFVLKNGNILVNELAPRPHNSGHWTIEGSRCSQFEQLVRSISGLKLGSTSLVGKSAKMINLLGNEVLNWEKLLSDENAHLHIYGKQEAREGRKMGHVTYIYY